MQREDSWQIHLQRISQFLVDGVDVWWSHTSNGFIFHDGDSDPDNSSDVLSLLHHRYHSVKDVEQRRDECWKKIIDEKIIIPAHSIKLYDSDGNKTGRMVYQNNTVTLESDPSTATFAEVEEFTNEESPATPQTVETQATPQTEILDSRDNVPSMEDEESACAEDGPSAESESSEINTASCINNGIEEHDERLKTSAGNCIKRLLGIDDNLVEFDDLRFKLKAAMRVGKNLKRSSKQNYAELQTIFGQNKVGTV